MELLAQHLPYTTVKKTRKASMPLEADVHYVEEFWECHKMPKKCFE